MSWLTYYTSIYRLIREEELDLVLQEWDFNFEDTSIPDSNFEYLLRRVNSLSVNLETCIEQIQFWSRHGWGYLWFGYGRDDELREEELDQLQRFVKTQKEEVQALTPLVWSALLLRLTQKQYAVAENPHEKATLGGRIEELKGEIKTGDLHGRLAQLKRNWECIKKILSGQATALKKCAIYLLGPGSSMLPGLMPRVDEQRPNGSLPYVPGLLNGKGIRPLGDIGASDNYVSEEYAQRNGLKIDLHKAGTTKLANGTSVPLVGSVRLKYRFLSGTRIYREVFKVLRNSPYDVILGKAFLQATETFGRFMKKRISWELPCGPKPVMFLGSTQQYMQGWLNGAPASTLADSWSNAMLVSEERAAAQGMAVDRSPEHCVRLQMGDGMIVTASGIVKDAQFAYTGGGPTHSCDLYVLEDLACDVILSCDFLCETGAFEQYYHLIFETRSSIKGETYEAILNAIVNLDAQVQQLKARCRELFRSSNTESTKVKLQDNGMTLAKKKQRLLQQMSEAKKLQDQNQQDIKVSEIRAELRKLEANTLQTTNHPSNVPTAKSSTSQPQEQAQQGVLSNPAIANPASSQTS